MNVIEVNAQYAAAQAQMEGQIGPNVASEPNRRSVELLNTIFSSPISILVSRINNYREIHRGKLPQESLPSGSTLINQYDGIIGSFPDTHHVGDILAVNPTEVVIMKSGKSKRLMKVQARAAQQLMLQVGIIITNECEFLDGHLSDILVQETFQGRQYTGGSATLETIQVGIGTIALVGSWLLSSHTGRDNRSAIEFLRSCIKSGAFNQLALIAPFGIIVREIPKGTFPTKPIDIATHRLRPEVAEWLANLKKERNQQSSPIPGRRGLRCPVAITTNEMVDIGQDEEIIHPQPLGETGIDALARVYLQYVEHYLDRPRLNIL